MPRFTWYGARRQSITYEDDEDGEGQNRASWPSGRRETHGLNARRTTTRNSQNAQNRQRMRIRATPMNQPSTRRMGTTREPDGYPGEAPIGQRSKPPGRASDEERAERRPDARATSGGPCHPGKGFTPFRRLLEYVSGIGFVIAYSIRMRTEAVNPLPEITPEFVETGG